MSKILEQLADILRDNGYIVKRRDSSLTLDSSIEAFCDKLPKHISTRFYNSIRLEKLNNRVNGLNNVGDLLEYYRENGTFIYMKNIGSKSDKAIISVLKDEVI